MSFDRSVIDLRPLEPHSCTDLGFSLARQWYWQLVKLYLMVFAPLILLCFVVAFVWPEYLTSAQLVLWWMKPLGELGLLTWCSQALFGGQASYRSSVLSAYKSLPRLLLNYLGLFRLSPTRGLSMCVVFLEKTAIGKGRRRLDVLSGSGSALTWVLVVGAHIEFILAIGLYLLVIYLIPFQTPLTEEFSALGAFAWVEFLESNLYLLCAFVAEVAFAPFFVCASFVHYINRRSRLEAWDIQHAFNAMKSRLAEDTSAVKKQARAATVMAGLLACVLVFTFAPQPVYAGAASDASQSIEEILQQDRFGHTSEQGRLQLRESDESEVEEDSDYDFSWLEEFLPFLESDGLKLTVTLVFYALVGWITFKLIRYMWPHILGLGAELSRSRRDSRGGDTAPIVIEPATFTDARKQMLAGNTREALSHLLQAVIHTVKQQDGLSIPASFTEAECEQVFSRSLDEHRRSAFTELLQVWRKLAYAGQDVPSMYADKVIENCESAFARADA